MEVFSPPYLFKKGIKRPVIKTAPERITYGQKFRVEIGKRAGGEQSELSAVLIRPGAVTHNNNMSQRHVGLRAEMQSPTQLSLDAPPNGNVAPPGYYMLFVLDRGVPSEARFVQVCLDHSEKTAQAELPTADMALWLRADCGIIADGANAVSAWYDLSGQGHHMYWHRNAEAGSLQRMPEWKRQELNGHDVIRFTYVNNWQQVWGGYLESANGPFLPGRESYTVFVVAHPWPTGPSGWSGVLGWGDFDDLSGRSSAVGLRVGPGRRSQDPPDYDSNWFNTLPKDPDQTSLGAFWGIKRQIWTGDKVPVPLTRASLLETSYHNKHWQLKVNSKLVEEAEGSGKNTAQGPLTVGRSGRYLVQQSTGEIVTGDFFRGDIAEILIYNRAVTVDERSAIYEYLRKRYDLW
jgi:hypothetical protein